MSMSNVSPEQRQYAMQSFINDEKLVMVLSCEQFREILEAANDPKQAGYHRLQDLDLSNIDVASVRSNFDGWHIENVVFSRFCPKEREKKEIFGLSFMGATLKSVCFAQAHLYRCNFDTLDQDAYDTAIKRLTEMVPNYSAVAKPQRQTTMTEVNFFLSELELCRFRNVEMYAADFRYSYVNDCTIREAKVTYGDFYFCNFRGCTTFDKTEFIYCSFTNCMFENNAIRISNIPQGVIQEHYAAYEHMVLNYPAWLHYNPSATFSSINHDANKGNIPSSQLSNAAEAANFYKNMSGIYAGKGLNRDSNRAYKRAKLNEIKYLHKLIAKSCREHNYGSAAMKISQLLLDYLTVAFGFGYMWWVVVFWFVVLIMVYGLYYYSHSTEGLEAAISYSFNNSLGPNEAITEIVNFFLASCQSAFGMLLIGFLGFIMANNLRNDS